VAGLLLILYVETHWIMSCVLHQELEAPLLLETLGAGARAFLPAFCIAEAIARFRTIERDARVFREQLTANRREAARMDLPAAPRLVVALETAIQEHDLLIQTLPQELAGFTERLFASPVEILPESTASIRRANGYVSHLAMSRGDAIVLATVCEHASLHADRERSFLSGNKSDFGPSTPAGAELRASGVRSLFRVQQALGWIGSRASG
jgi:hypothetical protein